MHRPGVRFVAMALTCALLLTSGGSPLRVYAAPSTADTHVVQPGETLSGIAAEVGSDVQTLLRLNELDNPDEIQAGQVLKLPLTHRTHVVQEGETLATIAEAEGVDASALAQANNLDDPNLLLVGASLVIPGGGRVVPAAAPPAPKPMQEPPRAVSPTPAPAVEQSAAPPPTAAPARPHIPTRGYLIQPGDTLAGIAAQFQTTVADLLAANGLSDPNLLIVGQTIQVPAPVHQHVVQPGETLAAIAAQEHVDLGTLVDLNGMVDPNVLSAGQVLLVPTDSHAIASAPAPKPTTEPTPEPTATQPPAPTPTPTQPPATPAATATPTPTSKPAKPAASPTPARTATPSPTPRPAVAGKAVKGDLAATALSLQGAPYVWGGSSPSAGFDCSGFVWYVAQQAGLSVGRGLQQQYDAGSHPKQSKLKRGDLVFFQNTYMPGLSHDGIYLGDGQFIHAADEQDGVTISNLNDDYWSAHWYGATRLSK